MTNEKPIDGRKTSWTPARRKAFSEYKKAHPTGNRNPTWWTEERKLESLRRMKAGIDRKLGEADG